MRLTDTQLIVLQAACARADRKLHPLPESIKNPMILERVQAGLLSRGLIEGEGKNATVTDAAFRALGIDLEPTGSDNQPAADEQQASTEENAAMAKTKTRKTKTAAGNVRAKRDPQPRAESKQAKMIELMRRPEGASLDELVKKFAWQPHTVRGAVAGALKKKMKLKVEATKDEKRGLVYKIAA